jgi:ParB/RepB/Spo0J family partition protein
VRLKIFKIQTKEKTKMPAKEITRLRDLKVSARDQLMIDPRIIQIEAGHNPRDYKLPENHAHLDELKGSIKEIGVLQPLMVRYEPSTQQAILVDGECRLRAVLELIKEGVEIEAVPTIQVSGGNEAERLVTALTANTGKPLSKWESGTAFKRLLGYGWTDEKIATRLGFNARFVREAIELSDATQEVKQMLSERAVTPSLALEAIKRDGSNAGTTLRRKVADAKAKGQKTAKRHKTSPVANIGKLVKALFSDVDIEALTESNAKFVEVKRASLLALYKHFNLQGQ